MLWASLLLLRLAHQLGNPLIKGSAGRLVGVRDSFLCVFFLFFCFHLSLSFYSYCTNPSSSLCLSHHHPARRVAASFFNPHLWPLYCYYILHSPGVLQWEVLAWKLSPLTLSPLNPSNPNKEKKKNTREVRNDRHIDAWRIHYIPSGWKRIKKLTWNEKKNLSGLIFVNVFNRFSRSHVISIRLNFAQHFFVVSYIFRVLRCGHGRSCGSGCRGACGVRVAPRLPPLSLSFSLDGINVYKDRLIRLPLLQGCCCHSPWDDEFFS